MFFDYVDRIILISIILLWAISCVDIKEDRENCPCRLEIVFSEDYLPAILSIKDSGLVLRVDTIIESGKYSMNVKKSLLKVNLCYSDYGMFDPEEGIKIEEGNECPPIYMSTKTYNTECMHILDTAVLYKEYCGLNINFSRGSDDMVYPYKVVLRGNVCGYDLDLTPQEGKYSYSTLVDSTGFCSIISPRQIDNSLILDIVDEGGVVRSFTIGEYIGRSGYDWQAKNLKDIDLEIDLCNTEFTIWVDEWSDSTSFELVI